VGPQIATQEINGIKVFALIQKPVQPTAQSMVLIIQAPTVSMFKETL